MLRIHGGSHAGILLILVALEAGPSPVCWPPGLCAACWELGGLAGRGLASCLGWGSCLGGLASCLGDCTTWLAWSSCRLGGCAWGHIGRCWRWRRLGLGCVALLCRRLGLGIRHRSLESLDTGLAVWFRGIRVEGLGFRDQGFRVI